MGVLEFPDLRFLVWFVCLFVCFCNTAEGKAIDPHASRQRRNP